MCQGTKRRKITKEFKIEAVVLSRQPGMTVAKAASDRGVPANTLYRWRNELAKTGEDAFRGNGRRTAEQAELARLRREQVTTAMMEVCCVAPTCPGAFDHAAAPSGTGALLAKFDENRRLREKERRILLWMIRFSQGCIALRDVQFALSVHVAADDLKTLYDHILDPSRRARTRALAVLFQLYGIHVDLVAVFLSIYRRTVRRHLLRFRQNGVVALLNFAHSNEKKYADPEYKQAIFSILHPPSSTIRARFQPNYVAQTRYPHGHEGARLTHRQDLHRQDHTRCGVSLRQGQKSPYE